MTISKEQRSVPRDVYVTRCDGPGCIVEVVSDKEYSQERAPERWLELIERLPPHGPTYAQLPGHLYEMLVFHQWKCLVAWLEHHRLGPDQVNVPIPTEDG